MLSPGPYRRTWRRPAPATGTPRWRPSSWGAIHAVGTGGDGSNYGQGTFFEGAITSGNPSDATDDAVQANIVAAGYGR